MPRMFVITIFHFPGAYDWAKQTLKAHEKDKREYVYSREKLEQGKTHDPLWNAAQVSKTFFLR